MSLAVLFARKGDFHIECRSISTAGYVLFDEQSCQVGHKEGGQGDEKQSRFVAKKINHESTIRPDIYTEFTKWRKR